MHPSIYLKKDEPVVDLASAKVYLSMISQDLLWLLRQIESQDGYLRFPPIVSRAIENLKIQSYPLLYEHPNAIAFCFLRGSLSDNEVKALNDELAAATPVERGSWISEFLHEVEMQAAEIHIPKTPEEEQALRRIFDELPEAEKVETVKQAQHLWMGFLAQFYEVLSVMVHGECLTQLVIRAKSGDDNAAVKAIQIDKRILTTLPYFRDRFQRAHMEGDQDFIDQLNYRLSCAPYKGKIRHKPLWFSFALLDMCGLLDRLTHPEILDLLNEVGISGYQSRIEDVKHLTRRLADYRRFQRLGIVVSTT